MKPEDCPILNTCPKIKMVLDHDFAGDWQCAQAIRDVCSACPGPYSAKPRMNICYDESGFTSGAGIIQE